MNIKELLTQNGFIAETEKISQTILNRDCGEFVNVRKMPSYKEDLFEGFEITDKNGINAIVINIEDDDEFARFATVTYDEEKDIYIEKYYDDDNNLFLIVEDCMVVFAQ